MLSISILLGSDVLALPPPRLARALLTMLTWLSYFRSTLGLLVDSVCSPPPWILTIIIMSQICDVM